MITALGFLFDTYELVIQALVVRPAVIELTPLRPGDPAFNAWIGWLLFLPAFCGGIAGLAGGWLVDRAGRRGVLIVSILVYGFATVMAGHARSPGELLLWRCVTITGVSVEWIAATTWIAETFAARRQRDAALGFGQAMGGLGVVMVGVVYVAAVALGPSLPAVGGSHAGWRYALLFGAVPVLPVAIARLGLPESRAWQAARGGSTKPRPSFAALFGSAYLSRTLIVVALVACIYAVGYGSLQHVPRIVPGLEATRGLTPNAQESAIGLVHLAQDVGGIAGRFAMAALLVTALTRRGALRGFLLAGLIILPAVFLSTPHLNGWLIAVGVFVAGLLFQAPMNFIGNYIPQLYPTELRGIGDSFAISVGGRMIGTAASLLTPSLANILPGHDAAEQLANAAAMVAGAACLLALIASRFMVEPDMGAEAL